jgi:hypothetical protein
MQKHEHWKFEKIDLKMKASLIASWQLASLIEEMENERAVDRLPESRSVTKVTWICFGGRE